MVTRISKDGLWRVSYGELTGLSHEEVSPFLIRLITVACPPTDEVRNNASGSSETRFLQIDKLHAL